MGGSLLLMPTASRPPMTMAMPSPVQDTSLPQCDVLRAGTASTPVIALVLSCSCLLPPRHHTKSCPISYRPWREKPFSCTSPLFTWLSPTVKIVQTGVAHFFVTQAPQGRHPPKSAVTLSTQSIKPFLARWPNNSNWICAGFANWLIDSLLTSKPPVRAGAARPNVHAPHAHPRA